MWNKLSAAAKMSFIDNQVYGQEVNINYSSSENAIHSQKEQIPENFILILCKVYSVDYLILSEPHRRYKSFCELDEWIEESVNP